MFQQQQNIDHRECKFRWMCGRLETRKQPIVIKISCKTQLQPNARISHPQNWQQPNFTHSSKNLPGSKFEHHQLRRELFEEF